MNQLMFPHNGDIPSADWLPPRYDVPECCRVVKVPIWDVPNPRVDNVCSTPTIAHAPECDIEKLMNKTICDFQYLLN
jgi:hypothetical protein